MLNRVSIIRTNPNKGKEETLTEFFSEAQTFVERIVRDLWFQGIGDFCPATKNFSQAPKFLDQSYLNRFDESKFFSARMRQTLGIIALGKVTSVTEKLRRKQWVIGKIQQKKDTGGIVTERDKKTLHNFSEELGQWIKEAPKVTNFAVNISRPDSVNLFEVNRLGKGLSQGTEVLRLTLAGKTGTLAIPVPKTKQSKKLEDKGFVKKLTAVALYSPTKVGLIYQREGAPKKTEGKTVGADQGISAVLTLSDRQVTDKNKHGQSLNDVLKHLGRKKRGSKGFRRSQEHRKNFINWSLNQLNFKDVKTIRLEHLKNVGKGHRTSRFLSSWTYPLIKKKLTRISELEGFQIEEVSNKFRSQRCNSCGHVNKANRKGKVFKCRHCGHTADADLNASFNLELDLPKVPNWVFEQKLNRKEGFFWTEEGAFAEEPIIPQDEERFI
jgi:hypothetical protein